jgi:hypothetical protein
MLMVRTKRRRSILRKETREEGCTQVLEKFWVGTPCSVKSNITGHAMCVSLKIVVMLILISRPPLVFVKYLLSCGRFWVN